MGMMKTERRRCGGASGSVTAMTRKKLAYRALVANHFSPLRTQWSSRRSARAVKVVGSAPPWGSVIEKQDTMSLASRG
ncbi:hypothetical protein D3C86_1642780 [compost metagenome]